MLRNRCNSIVVAIGKSDDRRQITCESLEHRLLMAAGDVRTFDGSGNNLTHTDWGSAGATLLRLAKSAYDDGVSTPAGATRPSARLVSNTVAAHPDAAMPSAQHLSAFAYLWGQFIDHDMDLSSSASPAEPFDIAVPAGDPWFDPTGTGTAIISLNRSKSAAGTGATSPRQQVNDITAYIDGSMIYGSDSTRDAALRSFVGGRLKTSAGDLMPFNTDGLANANDAHIFPDNQLFLAGDVRANENVELTAMHTLFLREHNRLADQIAAKNPTWSDEQIFQQARKIVIAEIQNITYNEFLPALLGRGAIAPYSGYKAGVNVGIATEFSTAAFRLGHSMLEDDVEFLDNNGNPTRDELPLAFAFFNPSVVEETGIDPIMKYLASTNAEEIDNKVVNGVRNFLFGPPGAGGFDLASLNIQRGRDHGLAGYNSTRAAMGLPRVTSFSQITSDADLAAKLQSLYGSVDNVDLWVGGLAEDRLPGSNLGPTFQRIVADQFTRLRDGDRFWFERDLNSNDLIMVRNTKLADVIARNSGTTNIQPNVFVFNVTADGIVWRDDNANGRPDLGEPPLPRVEVDLIDSNGAVTDTTFTDRNGHYHFDGMELGGYTIKPILPGGLSFTTASSASLAATRGMRFDHVDFGARDVRFVVQTHDNHLTIMHWRRRDNLRSMWM